MNQKHFHFLVVVILLLNCAWCFGHASFSANPSASHLQLLQRSKRTGGSESPGFNSKSNHLSSALRHLLTGQQPSPIPSTSSSAAPAKKTKLTKEERTAMWKQAELRAKELVSGPVSRFEGKHLYENGVHKGKVDSFEALTRDPIIAKKYLVDLNRKLYKGGVLPEEGTRFNTGINRMDKTSVTIVDADIDVLTKDLEPKLEAWKQAELARHGTLPDRVPNFTTDAQYKVTHLTFEPIKDADGKILEVSVNAEQYNTKVELRTDKNGKPCHFAKMNPADISQPINKIRERYQITKFTHAELQDIAKLAKQFWNDIGAPCSARDTLLNEQSQAFKIFVGQSDADLQSKVIQPSGSGSGGSSISDGICSNDTPEKRRRRAAGGGKACAIFLKPNGEVDSVHPKEFVDEHKKADRKGKEQLADLAKDNIDKMVEVDNNQNNQNQMKKLIHLKDKKTHVASVDAITKVQSPKTFTNAVDSLQTKLSGIKTTVQLSTSKISKKFSKLANPKAAKDFAKGVGTVSVPLVKYFLAKID